MREFRHPAAEPVYWQVTVYGVLLRRLVVRARLAIQAKDAARLFLRRRGIDYGCLEDLQVQEVPGPKSRAQVINQFGDLV